MAQRVWFINGFLGLWARWAEESLQRSDKVAAMHAR